MIFYIVVRPENSNNFFISIEDSISLVIKAVVEKVYYIIKEYFLYIRCKNNNINIIF